MYISDLYEDELEISIKVKSHRINQNDELETILLIISIVLLFENLTVEFVLTKKLFFCLSILTGRLSQDKKPRDFVRQENFFF